MPDTAASAKAASTSCFRGTYIFVMAFTAICLR